MSPKGKKSADRRRLAPARRPRHAIGVRLNCPIVGIGASSGGLEAFTQLLRQLPLDTGFGYVLVQHLDPEHESALTQLLARTTAMPVREVTNNLRVKANHVYVIPPNTSLGIAGGVLKLGPRSHQRTAARSIDSFFAALAQDLRERAIGVILSGNASDGTLGLEAIKAEGGLTFAQDASARYGSMPRSAAAAGCVDFVLSPAAIAGELARIGKHPYVAGRAPFAPPPVDALAPGAAVAARGRPRPAGKSAARSRAAPAVADALLAGPAEDGYQKILRLLRNHSRVDFSLYKSSTILRRITRRTVLNQKATLEDYAEFLQGNTRELDALYADALINVTSFFRNADAFAVVQRKVFAQLLRRKGREPVRVWVLGCSTGQEAYSLAMIFTEMAARLAGPPKLQVFATDLNEANLDKARQGFYAHNLVQDVSPKRLRRFFVEEEGGYRIIKQLREAVVFARQDIISDPPFSRMDVISCRNLMIYLEPSLQKKIIPTFHYALKPGAFLFLGVSESLGDFGHLFVPVDRKQKIFIRKAAPPGAFLLPLKAGDGERRAAGRPPHPAQPGVLSDALRHEVVAEREADRVTVNHFAPPGVLINADLQIMQFRGSTGAYLEPATGKASFGLLKMAREGLLLPLRATIHRAQRQQKSMRLENIPLTRDGETRLVNVEVIPLKNLPERCLLVLFEESTQALDPARRPPASRGRASPREETSRIAGLERDLSDTRDYLQYIQEHQETATEELQASHEEGQSANEELQSLNEELETSKEELESTNEELTTVNEEMVNRNTELSQLNGELGEAREHAEAIIRTVALPLLTLTADLRVQSCNEAFGSAFQVEASELKGRPLLEVEEGAWNVPGLRALLGDVIVRDGFFADFAAEAQFKRVGLRSLLLNACVLKETGGKAKEILLGVQDITDRRRGEEALHEARTQLAHHASRLERLVAARTAALTASNRELRSSVASIKRGQEEYRTLLGQSEVLQKQLRHLTHKILTAQEEERKEISRELHDEVVQTLIGINVELSALSKLGAVSAEVLKDKVSHTQRLVETSVNAVHRFARGLRPAVLDDLGLIPALHAYSKSLAAKGQIKIQLTAFGGVEALGDAERTILFRVAQEALTNVGRHAEATEVQLNITQVGKAIRMEIKDNGKSFHVGNILAKNNNKRLGLVGMNERIEMIGGTLAIESAPGQGTTVRAEIPFNPPKTKK